VLARMRRGHPLGRAWLPGQQAQLQPGEGKRPLDPDHAVPRMSPTAGWARDKDKDKHTIAAGGHRLVLRAVEGHVGPARQVVCTMHGFTSSAGRRAG